MKYMIPKIYSHGRDRPLDIRWSLFMFVSANTKINTSGEYTVYTFFVDLKLFERVIHILWSFFKPEIATRDSTTPLAHAIIFILSIKN